MPFNEQESASHEISKNQLVEVVSNLNFSIKVKTENDEVKSKKPQSKKGRCEICKRHFKSAQGLKSHLNFHLANKKNPPTPQTLKEVQFKCKFCDYCAKKETLFKSHMQKHENQEKKLEMGNYIRCGMCNAAVSQTWGMKNHMENAHPETTIQCELCNTKLKIMQTYKRHMYKQHPREARKYIEKREIDEASKKLKDIKNLADIKQEPSSCGSLSQTLENFKQQFDDSKDEIVNEFLFINIKQEIANEEPIVNFKEEPENQNEIQEFGNDSWTNCFKSAQALQSHSVEKKPRKKILRRKKFKEVMFKCKRCVYCAHDKIRFKLHMQKHEKQDQKFKKNDANYTRCELCSSPVNSKYGMSRHMRLVHPTTTIQCELCNTKLKVMQTYKQHMYKQHPDEAAACIEKRGIDEASKKLNVIEDQWLVDINIKQKASSCDSLSQKLEEIKQQFDEPEEGEEGKEDVKHEFVNEMPIVNIKHEIMNEAPIVMIVNIKQEPEIEINECRGDEFMDF